MISTIALAASACLVPPVPAPVQRPPTPAPGIYYEEDLTPVERLRLEILDLQETPSDDKTIVVLTGTLINRGTKATSELSVKIEALDADDRVIVSVPALPSTEHVGPGTTATFTATIVQLPDVRRYHVEAIAK